MSKFKRKRIGPGLLASLKEATIMETAYLSCRRDIIFHLDEYIEMLAAPIESTSYERRKRAHQIEILQTVRCSIRNYVSP